MGLAQWKAPETVLPGLTKYDMVRRPIRPISDPDRVVVLDPRRVDSELVCAVCLSVCSSTLTTMECVHRFCSDCIVSGLRIG